MNVIEFRPHDLDNVELGARIICPICKTREMSFCMTATDTPWYEALNYMVAQVECEGCFYSTTFHITLYPIFDIP